MKQYKTVNNLVGWLTFIIAATVYCMTIEPTASFWDCPEFITTGYKLEVGHPPGAPFFMLTANLFSQFASDATTVAKMVNYMSALMSGACILFPFLEHHPSGTQAHYQGRKQHYHRPAESPSWVAALSVHWYTPSATPFWFSAVEGEVYAYSSLFTAVVFWLILKWEDVADQPHSDRWIILIAYLTGLSIGVHSAEPALSARHRTGILLQKSSQRQRQRFAVGALRFYGAGRNRALRYRARRSKSRRMVRVAFRQQHGLAIQYRRHCLYHHTCRQHYLGSI